MSRITSRVDCAIWLDLTSAEISADARLLFLHLATSSEVSMAGVTPLTPARWARLTALTVTSVEHALDELATAGYVLVDRDSCEVLVHAFRKWNPPAPPTTPAELVHGVTSAVIRKRLGERRRGNA